MDKTSSPQSPRRYMDFAPRSKATRAPRPQSAHPVAPVRPAPTPRPLAPRPPRPQAKIVHEHVEATTILYPSHNPVKRHPVKEDDYLDIETSGLGIIEDLGSTAKADTPDNASFVLGGHSPFINTDKIAKRPLSSHLPKEKLADKAKNTYNKTAKSSRKAVKTPTVVTGSASRANSISLVIAIILTVIAGAIVGTFIYLAFFQ